MRLVARSLFAVFAFSALALSGCLDLDLVVERQSPEDYARSFSAFLLSQESLFDPFHQVPGWEKQDNLSSELAPFPDGLGVSREKTLGDASFDGTDGVALTYKGSGSFRCEGDFPSYRSFKLAFSNDELEPVRGEYHTFVCILRISGDPKTEAVALSRTGVGTSPEVASGYPLEALEWRAIVHRVEFEKEQVEHTLLDDTGWQDVEHDFAPRLGPVRANIQVHDPCDAPDLFEQADGPSGLATIDIDLKRQEQRNATVHVDVSPSRIARVEAGANHSELIDPHSVLFHLPATWNETRTIRLVVDPQVPEPVNPVPGNECGGTQIASDEQSWKIRIDSTALDGTAEGAVLRGDVVLFQGLP